MEPFIGQIILFAGNFNIRGYTSCSGQILSIAQNTALFSILGTTYGGNGQTTFALPDLRGRMAVGVGNGPGLNGVELGEMSGTQSTTLTIANLPAHNHQVQFNVQVSTNPAGTDEPAGAFLTGAGSNFYATAGSAGNNLGGVSGSDSIAGNNAPFGILPPYLGLNYQIALQGIFPSRN